jgi:hypothetical protein
MPPKLAAVAKLSSLFGRITPDRPLSWRRGQSPFSKLLRQDGAKEELKRILRNNQTRYVLGTKMRQGNGQTRFVYRPVNLSQVDTIIKRATDGDEDNEALLDEDYDKGNAFFTHRPEQETEYTLGLFRPQLLGQRQDLIETGRALGEKVINTNKRKWRDRKEGKESGARKQARKEVKEKQAEDNFELRMRKRKIARAEPQPKKKQKTLQGTGRKERVKSAALRSGRGTEPYKRVDGAVCFFPYVNSTPLDLEYAQVFSRGMDEEEVPHCLVSTLRYYGIDEAVCQGIALKLLGNAFHIPRKYFKIVADMSNSNLLISMCRNDTQFSKLQFTVNAAKPQRTLRLGIFMNHIFPNIMTTHTVFYLRNIDKIEQAIASGHLDEQHRSTVFRTNSTGTFVTRAQNTYIDTLTTLKELYILGKFTECSTVQRIKVSADIVLSQELLPQEQRCWAPVEPDDEDTHLGSVYFAADFESYVQGVHEPCLAAAHMIGDDANTNPSDVCVFTGEGLVEQLFQYFYDTCESVENDRRGAAPSNEEDEEKDEEDEEKEKLKKLKSRVIYFHNLRYDRTLFERDRNIRIQKVTVKDGNVYGMRVAFKGMMFDIRDSYKLIPIPLSKFGSTFSLPSHLKKQEEFILYDFYSPVNLQPTFRCSLADYTSGHFFAGGEEERDAFSTNLRKLLEAHAQRFSYEMFENDYFVFSPFALYIYYLEYDVAVMSAGLTVFRQEFLELTNEDIDPLDCLTISSLSYRLMGIRGAFEESYMVTGNMRAFLAKSVYGGRVFVNPLYEGKKVEEKLDYFDACSLYPSAIAFICEQRGGFPTGEAKVITPSMLQSFDTLVRESTEFTVKIRIISIHKKQLSVPFIAYRSEKEGTLSYIQELTEPIEVYVDKQTLLDYIEYHQIEFSILEGVYWEGELNNAWGEIVQELYAQRLIAKQEGKKVKAELIKLVLNSAYGKTITRASNSEVMYIQKFDSDDDETNWTLTLSNLFNVAKSWREVGDHQLEVTRHKLDDSFNMTKYGSMILAASKHIMNEVFNLMSDHGLPIYYTDTDSFVMRKDDRAVLADLFQERFNRKLIGKKLGNMHSDFSFQLEGKEVDPELVNSYEFYPAGRKLYLHRLEAVVDGVRHTSLQYKAKGCTSQGMKAAAAQLAEGDEGMVQLYQKLCEGKEMKILLNPPGQKVMFVYSKDNRCTTPMDPFYRLISSQAAKALGKAATSEIIISDEDHENVLLET